MKIYLQNINNDLIIYFDAFLRRTYYLYIHSTDEKCDDNFFLRQEICTFNVVFFIVTFVKMETFSTPNRRTLAINYRVDFSPLYRV